MRLSVAKTRTHTAAVVLALAFAAPLSAQAPAQCPLTEYSITGTVVARDDVPVPGARLTAEWEEGAGALAKTRARSAADGRFALKVQFDTYSGQTFTGDRKCEAVLESVQVQVQADGYRDISRSVPLGPEPTNVKLELRAR